MPPKGAGKLGANETKNKNKPLSIAPQDADYLNIQQFCSIQQPEGKASLSDAKGSQCWPMKLYKMIFFSIFK